MVSWETLIKISQSRPRYSMKHLLTCFLISDILWQRSPIDKLDCEKENQMEREMLRVVKSR